MNAKLIVCVGIMLAQVALYAALSPEEARRIYGESSSAPEASVEEKGEYVFFRLEWEEDADATEEDREAQELATLLNALQKYLTPTTRACTNSPFCSRLTSWLIPDFEFQVPNVESCIVKDCSSGLKKIQIIACDAAALKSAKLDIERNANKINERCEHDWINALNEAYDKFCAEGKRDVFLQLLGCPIVELIEGKDIDFLKLPIEGAEEASQELIELIDSCAGEGGFFRSRQILCLNSAGESRHREFLPNWKDSDNGKFDEAIGLYRKGRDLDRIIDLLVESIRINPVDSLKWGYLGGSLKVSGKDKEAIFAYIQSLRINDKNKWAWKGLHECCEKAGVKKNAAGLAWYLKLRREL